MLSLDPRVAARQANQRLLRMLEAAAKAGEEVAQKVATAPPTKEAEAAFSVFVGASNVAFGFLPDEVRVDATKGRVNPQSIADVAVFLGAEIAALRLAKDLVQARIEKQNLRMACADVERILQSFEAVVRKLKGSPGFDASAAIASERGVQNLLEALLVTTFADVRREEAASSIVGANSRLDFLLKEHGIGIEVKIGRKSPADAELGGEIIEDLMRYSSLNLKALYFFVWDPQHSVRNAAGIRRDASERARELEVMVMFSPPRK